MTVLAKNQVRPADPTNKALPALQKHLFEVCEYFDWNKNSDEKTFLMLAEEVGELAKAVRKALGVSTEVGKEQTPEQIQGNLQEELADCLIYIMDLANRFNVDLEKAYLQKIAVNYGRAWHVGK